MNLLKYLDVLIGLAVVMLLLSPMVSAITQVWMWLTNTRSGRLQVALKNLILHLNGNEYERFEAVRVTGFAPGTAVSLGGAGFPAVNAIANGAGEVVFQDNIAGRLKAAGGGHLTYTPPLTAGQTETVLARGPVGAWEITSPTAADPNGLVVTLNYEFPGPLQFTSFRANILAPAGVNLVSAKIASGTLSGTELTIAEGILTYPANARPVPKSHKLEITLGNTGALAPGAQIALRFQRNDSFDQLLPLPAAPVVVPPVPVVVPPAPGAVPDLRQWVIRLRQWLIRPVPVAGPVASAAVQAEQIARAVLLHPIVARPAFLKWMRSSGSKRADVIEREELIRILLEYAADGPNGLPELAGALPFLRQSLAANGISDPGRVLAVIRERAQELEKSDPAKAAHTRLSQAILDAAPSPFVGKINNWFDQAMQRTTAEYGFRAQIVTVIGAFFVALAVQMDSLDLLKRLSTDDKLRDSLVSQAQEQQKRMDEQKNKEKNQDEIQLAKARREEIEANLAKLRDPQFAILPDHFIWQPLPRARLTRNPAWAHPYSKRLELVVGATSYPIEPRWTDRPLLDIRAAIDNSIAPVTTRVEKGRALVIRAERGTPAVEDVHIHIDGTDRVVRDEGQAQAGIQQSPHADAPQGNEKLYLIAGYDDAVPIQADPDGKIKSAIEKSKAAVSVDSAGSILTATKDDARWIELRRIEKDPNSNILKRTEFPRVTGHFDKKLLDHAKECQVSVASAPPDVTCKFEEIESALRKHNVSLAAADDDLVLTSRRSGLLQLRSVSGKPESNMLNRAEEFSCPYFMCFDWDMMRRSWVGVVLTWMLLSLGAPFWYDALKDLLKLRSSLASKEEAARNERLSETKPAPEGKALVR